MFISSTNTIVCNIFPLALWWHVLSFVMRTPWEHIQVWNLHDCTFFQNIYLSYKQNCLNWNFYTHCSDGDYTAMRTHTGNMCSVSSWEHHENTYKCETCMTACAFKTYTYLTNRIVCIEIFTPTVLMVIYTAMRTRTGKQPANLQVPSGFIYPKPQLFIMTNIFPLVLWWLPLIVCSATRTHAGEKPAKRLVLAEIIHWPKHGCNDNNNFTIQCHMDTYW